MTFIVTLIALLIERFFDWSHLRQWRWFTRFQNNIVTKLPKANPYLLLTLTILPLLVVLMTLQFIISGLLYGFIGLVLQLALLVYCMGPQNLWANGFACINNLADKPKDKKAFAANDNYTQSLHRHLIDNIFIEANRRVFAVVFWYVLIGPIGALLYRTITLSGNQMVLATVSHNLEDILNWIPTRILTFFFALGGHFVSVLDTWRKKVLVGLDGNEMLLTECGIAALGSNDLSNLPDDGTIERHAISLIDRVFVILLVFLAIGVLVG